MIIVAFDTILATPGLNPCQAEPRPLVGSLDSKLLDAINQTEHGVFITVLSLV